MISMRFPKRQRTGKEGGFTLIELLVVIAIIGLLSSIVLAQLGTARQKARDAKRVADMQGIMSALELYYSDHSSSYPTTPTGNLLSNLASALTSYVGGGSLPVDPLNTGSYVYKYCSSNVNISYVLAVVLEKNATQCSVSSTGVDTCGGLWNLSRCSL